MATVNVNFPIHLEALAGDHEEFSSVRVALCVERLSRLTEFLQYEPELFPGLVYRMLQPKIACMIFVSGKVVITGAKVRNHHLWFV